MAINLFMSTPVNGELLQETRKNAGFAKEAGEGFENVIEGCLKSAGQKNADDGDGETLSKAGMSITVKKIEIPGAGLVPGAEGASIVKASASQPEKNPVEITSAANSEVSADEPLPLEQGQAAKAGKEGISGGQPATGLHSVRMRRNIEKPLHPPIEKTVAQTAPEVIKAVKTDEEIEGVSPFATPLEISDDDAGTEDLSERQAASISTDQAFTVAASVKEAPAVPVDPPRITFEAGGLKHGPEHEEKGGVEITWHEESVAANKTPVTDRQEIRISPNHTAAEQQDAGRAVKAKTDNRGVDTDIRAAETNSGADTKNVSSTGPTYAESEGAALLQDGGAAAPVIYGSKETEPARPYAEKTADSLKGAEKAFSFNDGVREPRPTASNNKTISAASKESGLNPDLPQVAEASQSASKTDAGKNLFSFHVDGETQGLKGLIAERGAETTATAQPEALNADAAQADDTWTAFADYGEDTAGSEQNSNTPQGQSRDAGFSFQTFVDKLPAQTAPAGVEAKAASVVNTADIHARLEEGVRLSVAGNGREIKIKLHPDNLGEMQIKINMSDTVGKKVTAEIVVENQSVKEAISADLGSIKEAFGRQGLVLEKCSVELGGSNFSGAGNGNGNNPGNEALRDNPYRNGAKGLYSTEQENEVSTQAQVNGAARTYADGARAGVDLFI